MSIFSGLGGALGAAAGGFVSGQQKAGVENERRRRLAEQEALKRLVLEGQNEGREQQRKYQDASLDLRREGLQRQKDRDAARPGEEHKKLGQRMHASLVKTLRDPRMQAYLRSPQGMPLRKRLERDAQTWLSVGMGEISPDEMDTYELSGFPEPNEEPPTATPPPAPRPNPNIPPAGPLIGPPITPELWPRVQAMMPQPSPADQYREALNNPPMVEPLPGEMPQDTEGRRRTAMTEHDRLLARLFQSAQMDDLLRRNAAAATTAEAGAAVAPEVARQKVVGGTERIKKTREDIRASRIINPIKAKQGEVAIARGKQDLQLKPKQDARAERVANSGIQHQRKTEQQADTREANAERNRKAQLDKAREEVKGKARNAEEQSLQKEVATNIRIQTATKGDVVGAEYHYSAPRRAQAQKEMEAGLARLRQIRAEGKPGSAAPAAAAPKGGKGTKMFMGKPYTWDKFYREGKSKGGQDADLKRGWAAL